MEPQKVKDCLNKHLLGNPLKKAVGLAYREIMTTVFESLDLDLDDQRRKIIEYIIEGLGATSYLPENAKDQDVSIFDDPETFRALGIVYSRLISLLEYSVENYDTLPDIEVKNIWKKGNFNVLIKAHNRIWEAHRDNFIENGYCVLPPGAVEQSAKILYLGFRFVLGQNIAQKFSDELSASVTILNAYIDQIMLALRLDVSKKPS